jgi:anhydro-N-acetylmuramic acid kinase
MNTYNVIGIMSGTSLDGVDIALCKFDFAKGKWKFKIEEARTVPYSAEWKKKLSTLHLKNAHTFALTHVEYGNYLGTLVKKFIGKKKFKVDFVSSHGHTIFHQPEKKFTSQIGDGAALSAACGLPVVCDFRTTDVALGGEGAPLVPIGDKLLFPEYDYCLNLGGIANISFENKGERWGLDVCYCNMVLNHLAQKLGLPYDKDGKVAHRNMVHPLLSKKIVKRDLNKKSIGKSLSREGMDKYMIPLLDNSNETTEDKISTFTFYIAVRISAILRHENKTALITGGGAHNKALVNIIRGMSKAKIVLPEKEVIDFKEALIFAFLGVLRWRGEINVLKSVTRASHDSCSGSVYLTR